MIEDYAKFISEQQKNGATLRSSPDSLVEGTRKEIDKKEYDSIKKHHEMAKKLTSKYGYAHALYVRKDDEGNVVHQTYSHPSHKIPAIEKSGEKYWKFDK